MNYFDSAAGWNLGDILKRDLPKIAMAISTRQYTIDCQNPDQAADVITQKISDGDEYVGHITRSNGGIVLIMKTKEEE